MRSRNRRLLVGLFALALVAVLAWEISRQYGEDRGDSNGDAAPEAHEDDDLAAARTEQAGSSTSATDPSRPSGPGVADESGGQNEAARPEARSTPIALDFLYSTEKRGWLEESVRAFEALNPDIDVRLTGRGSLRAVRDILEGRAQPTVWSPADTVAVRLLSDGREASGEPPLVELEGDDAPVPLVRTALVFVAWEDRGAVLAGEDGELSWAKVRHAVTSEHGFASIGGPAAWGPVKLGHTDPTLSNSGLQAIILMASDFHQKSADLEEADILDPGFQAFVASIERGVPKLGRSTGSFMKDMILYGPSKYDVVVSYESLAIEQIPRARARWGNLNVYYPKQTLISSHPFVILDAEWVSEAQRDAARRLRAYLRSPEAQERALRYGLRPADPAIPVVSDDPENPFSQAADYGVRAQLGSTLR